MKDSSGYTALWYTMESLDEKHKKCFEVLYAIEEEKTKCICGGAKDLFDAAQRGCCYCCWKHFDQAGKTRDNYKIPNWGTYNGATALMVAAACGKASVVRMLLDKEGGMHETTFGMTAMMFAASNGHECVKILAPLEKGMQKNDGWTALMLAAMNGHLECVKILAPLEKGMKDNNGNTAKSIASSNNHKDCYSYLSQFE